MQVGGGLPQPNVIGNAPTYRYYFNIGSVDSFERKMEEAQEDMGLPPTSWVRPAALCMWLALAHGGTS